MDLNIDAEEAARLELSMDVIEAVLRDQSLVGWDGFGIVVQAYGKRARFVIDWYYQLALELGRKVKLRLVKGAYWDSEIKLAQVDGLNGFPLFTTKSATDVSYLENAAHLLRLSAVIFPQFATHNAHTIASILELSRTIAPLDGASKHNDAPRFEFQRLHGMGQTLYDLVLKQHRVACRIYAPVGEHQDLLAYLVRRLLENGANSSFVNQILDKNTPAAIVARDPYEQLGAPLPAALKQPRALFGERVNAKGWDLADLVDLEEIRTARRPYEQHHWQAEPLLVRDDPQPQPIVKLFNPAKPEHCIGELRYTSTQACAQALDDAQCWRASTQERANCLRKAADLYEQNFGEIFALLSLEAGKTLRDAVAELREAVDFLRYYADQAQSQPQATPRGVIACISPWNFPLAIFTGQIAAALATGNAVLAKPAESTTLIAALSCQLLHQAGVPRASLQLLPGLGSTIGDQLSKASALNGLCFTGSTATAQRINRNMAENAPLDASFIAETGGLNAMIVDSTALSEQVVRDVVISAFQSAGQRCSACRVLFVQDEVADKTLTMLFGAMDALVLGDPYAFESDIGPVIDQKAKAKIESWIESQRQQGRLLKQCALSDQLKASAGHYVAPTVIALDHINQLQEEIFGPVLHVIRYQGSALERIMKEINETGYGLTFGMHSRIDERVDLACTTIKAGNLYINRNQIGAIVGSQPFGGHGLSGTGPKAGGPLYLHRFAQQWDTQNLPLSARLPGPTGESNFWQRKPCERVLCLGPSADDEQQQAALARAQGCDVILGRELSPAQLQNLAHIERAVYWGESEQGRPLRRALAARQGAIVPFITARDLSGYLWVEQHICVDTTASGGNAELLAGA